MKNLSKAEIAKIKTNLPSLRRLIEKEDTDYQKIFISIFDHWLTPEEFQLNIHTDDIAELNSRRKKLEDFIVRLYEITPTYSWKYKRHYRFFLYSFNSFDQLIKKCNIKNQIGTSGQQYDILLPELNAVYSEEWDWTNIIWYRDKKKIIPLLEMAANSGLYILEK